MYKLLTNCSLASIIEIDFIANPLSSLHTNLDTMLIFLQLLARMIGNQCELAESKKVEESVRWLVTNAFRVVLTTYTCQYSPGRVWQSPI